MNGFRILYIFVFILQTLLCDVVSKEDGLPIDIAFTPKEVKFPNLYEQKNNQLYKSKKGGSMKNVINLALMKEKYVKHVGLHEFIKTYDTVQLPLFTILEIAIEVYYHKTPSTVDRAPLLMLQTKDNRTIIKKRILDSGTSHAAYQLHIGSVVYTEKAYRINLRSKHYQESFFYKTMCSNCWEPVNRLVVAADCNYVSIRRIIVKGVGNLHNNTQLLLGYEPVHEKADESCLMPPFTFCNQPYKVDFKREWCTFIFNEAYRLKVYFTKDHYISTSKSLIILHRSQLWVCKMGGDGDPDTHLDAHTCQVSTGRMHHFDFYKTTPLMFTSDVYSDPNINIVQFKVLNHPCNDLGDYTKPF